MHHRALSGNVIDRWSSLFAVRLALFASRRVGRMATAGVSAAKTSPSLYCGISVIACLDLRVMQMQRGGMIWHEQDQEHSSGADGNDTAIVEAKRSAAFRSPLGGGRSPRVLHFMNSEYTCAQMVCQGIVGLLETGIWPANSKVCTKDGFLVTNASAIFGFGIP
ncbi:hypothetical protein FISHEDRAFT_61821 [Fistulina hepatica ATCC 64428]|uniref:Uncharacterized protein n=1 Tax=Fistulina hepatica ATCC 64428 TaxID=1128425 RepID=A0A0D7A2E4_9AGAR|nr:hypothetical protein FISHEDRAFT_61821 [Fistulina hepatica ATCC 64428]